MNTIQVTNPVSTNTILAQTSIPELYLEVGDGYFLDIGDGFKLIIQSEVTGLSTNSQAISSASAVNTIEI